MAPVASITRKQAPNWRVATIRRSIAGLRRLISHGIISTNASTQTTATPTIKVEPNQFVLEPAVEHKLERTEEGRDEREADSVEPLPVPPQPPAPRRCGLGLAQDQRNQPHRDQAYRAIDHKGPAPREIVGEPAAERRPDHRRYHDRHAKQREALAALFRRERIPPGSIAPPVPCRRRRRPAQCGTAAAHRDSSRPLRAEHRTRGEQRQTDQEEGLAAEALGEEGARRQTAPALATR